MSSYTTKQMDYYGYHLLSMFTYIKTIFYLEPCCLQQAMSNLVLTINHIENSGLAHYLPLIFPGAQSDIISILV